jgi:thiamine biosynthesis lipoprotein ApbE
MAKKIHIWAWPAAVLVACVAAWALRRAQGASTPTVQPLAGQSRRFEARFEAMDTDARFVVSAGGHTEAQRMVNRAFRAVTEIQHLMSTYEPDSEISRLNLLGSRESVALSSRTVAVLRAAGEAYRQTGGAFDVTYAPLRAMWRRARDSNQLPEEPAIRAALAAVGYPNQWSAWKWTWAALPRATR